MDPWVLLSVYFVFCFSAVIATTYNAVRIIMGWAP